MTDPTKALRELVRDSRVWVEIATVDTVEEHDAWGFLLNLEIQPSGQPVQARPMYAGTGAATGDLWPVEAGDEVLVLLPSGEPNRAVALCGLTSSQALPPSDWDNVQPMHTHAQGKEFRTAEGASVEAVLLAETFQSEAGTWEAALYTFMNTISSATTAAQIAVAAALFLVNCGSYKDQLAAAAYSAAAVKSE